MKIWIDFENTPQVHFLLAIKEMLSEKKHEFNFSARDVFETVKLLKQKSEYPIKTFGHKHKKSLPGKLYLMLSRFIEVYYGIDKFDLSLSCGSESAIWTSALKRKKSIAFGDNDTARQWTYGRFVDFSFFPKAIDAEILIRQGINHNKLYQYNGFKENIYIALYKPDSEFLKKIPFKNFVLVRPENLYANYIKDKSVKSIVPQLAKSLVDKGINILYLPKYKIDYEYIDKNSRIFIPEEPLNGLDACYFADAVLTGAGTFAREAACLGTPSVSFYAGKNLLAVDKELIRQKLVYFSRSASDIVDYSMRSRKKILPQTSNMEVYQEVKENLYQVIKKLNLN